MDVYIRVNEAIEYVDALGLGNLWPKLWPLIRDADSAYVKASRMDLPQADGDAPSIDRPVGQPTQVLANHLMAHKGRNRRRRA